MFEHCFVEGRVKTSRGLPVAASFLLQVCLICVGILVPLLNPEMLPRAILAAYLVTPPLPPAPRPITPAAETFTRRVVKTINTAGFYQPTTYPAQAQKIVDAPPDMGPFVEGSVPGPSDGVRNSVLASLVASVQRPVAPPPTPVREAERTPNPGGRITLGGVVVEALIISRKLPEYPVLAKQAGVSGVVVFKAVIGRDGSIQDLRVMSGHPLLVKAAADAVRQWRYRPTLLNGDPVEVDTTIQVSFTMNRQ